MCEKRKSDLNYSFFSSNGLSRKYLVIISSLVLLWVVMVFSYIPPNFSREVVGSAVTYLINTSTCRIPNHDPFNEDVKKFIYKVAYMPCSHKLPLTYLEMKDELITLNINQSLLKSYSFFKISCCYSAVTRASDDELRFSECFPFERSANISDFIVKVRCRNFINANVYSNVHIAIHPKHIEKQEKTKKKLFNILFLGIDSISKMNLVRTMPKTFNYLETRDFINLRGYTKISDNTFPNLMAILSGKTWTQIYNYCNPEKNKVNTCSIIWDQFRKFGYVTAYAEDEYLLGTFNHGKQGFSDPPTDLYFRPYLMAAESLPSIKRLEQHICSGPENTGERIMSLAKDFIVNLEDYPKFGLFWMNSFSHNDINLASSMDDKIEMFLKSFDSHLDNTVFIFFSDHGFRFGDIRYTYTGWLEERLPFIYVYLPKRFKQRYPKEANNFMTNAHRLTTPFDLYMTLQDFLKFADESYQVQESQACPKCQSLFKEVNENRTCAEAGIAQHWCLCTGHSYVNPKGNIVIDTGQFVVSKVNELIASSKGENRCAFYYLRKVVSSGESETYLNEFNERVYSLLIMLETVPPAMFEATVEVLQQTTPRYRLLGEISRINRYGDNGRCIESSLQKYCYCDTIFTSVKSAICTFVKCI